MIEWKGGECPAHGRVRVKYRNGETVEVNGAEVGWARYGRPSDIVAYEIVELHALATQVGGSHYKDLKIQPIEYLHANNIPFAEGNVIKYVTRWRAKNGIADLKKARHFIDLLIELEERDAS